MTATITKYFLAVVIVMIIKFTYVPVRKNPIEVAVARKATPCLVSIALSIQGRKEHIYTVFCFTKYFSPRSSTYTLPYQILQSQICFFFSFKNWRSVSCPPKPENNLGSPLVLSLFPNTNLRLEHLMIIAAKKG